MNSEELVQAIKNDEKLEEKWDDGWKHCSHARAVSIFPFDTTLMRIAPTLKPVDLSVLIESQIDCEFELLSGILHIGKLSRIENGYYYPTNHKERTNTAECRPRMNHWHSWQGGDCPLPEGLVVNVIYRNSAISANVTIGGVDRDMQWAHVIGIRDLKVADIIAFEVTGLANGYCWPWQITND